MDAENIANALGEVKYEKLPDDSFVKFRIEDSTIVVNKEHPFVAEHSGSRAVRELMRTVAMVNLLTDMYALDIGVEPATLANIRNYRDMLMRYRALQSRQSGTLIAKLLLQKGGAGSWRHSQRRCDVLHRYHHAFAHRAADLVYILIVQDREEPSGQIGPRYPEVLFDNGANEAALHEIVGSRRVASERPSVSSQPRNFILQKQVKIAHRHHLPVVKPRLAEAPWIEFEYSPRL